MMEWIIIPLLLAILMFTHEMGHIIIARLLRLQITGFGFKLKPYPHPYVSVKWPVKTSYRNLYLAGGMLMTLALFTVSYVMGILIVQQVAIAFTIQFILEMNPFYSDITIGLVYQRSKLRARNNFQKEHANHQFSPIWYVHFLAWAGIIFLFINLIQSD